MKVGEIEKALTKIADAAKHAEIGRLKFNADMDYVMTRLVFEAAANFMPVEDVARFSGLSIKRLRTLMRSHGLDPKQGRRFLAKQAAQHMAENAAMMGIEPADVDLMSPLAYLPMGEKMKAGFIGARVAPVTEDEVDTLADRLGPVVAEMVGCGHDESGSCGACQSDIAKIMAVVAE